jgi:hypothetical protein
MSAVERCHKENLMPVSFASHRDRVASFVFAASLCGLLSACASAPPPPAAPPPDSQRGMGEHSVPIGGTNLLSRSGLNQQFCFDAAGDKAADGTKVTLFNCHGRENQRWVFSDQPEGQIAITGIGGLCLDVRGHKAGDGTPLQLWQCANQPNQKFRHENDGRIREVQTGKCLTVSNLAPGAALTIDECNRENGGQVWVISH